MGHKLHSAYYIQELGNYAAGASISWLSAGAWLVAAASVSFA